MNNRRWWTWFTCWFTTPLWVIVSYTVGRASLLDFGRFHVVIKTASAPLLFDLRPWIGSHEIRYRADVGRGLMVLDPSLGIVVSGATVAGWNLVLTGGKCIGGRVRVRDGDIVLEDNVLLGVNAVVLGPVRLGNGVLVGAGAVVIRDAEDGQVLVGVPAASLPRSAEC